MLDDVVSTFGDILFNGYRIKERASFKLTRDADFGVDEDERGDDFLTAMEEVLVNRQSSDPVRLSIEANAGPELKERLRQSFELEADDVYELPGPIDLRSFMELTSVPGFDKLREAPWKPIEATDVPTGDDAWDELKRRDALLFVPYENFDPVLRFIDRAADDPNVLSIKMTLYRTSGDSPIVKALERAARNGKQVMALVELKARFDEGRNISWATRLERAGVIVVYGIARLKVHAKATMVVRRESDGIHRYVHLSTGNYNDKTARLYVDLSLFSADDDLCYDVSIFFNALSGYSEVQQGRRLVMAPLFLKDRIISLIQREATRKSQEYPGTIIAKMNALTDPDVIEALYKASQAGVKIKLNIRGICRLVPGVKGLSENISVVSVVDRYLEHARIFYFSNGGAEEVYLASADLMERNLEKRVELLIPLTRDYNKRNALEILKAYFKDNVKAWRLQSDGVWKRRSPEEGEAPFRVQDYFRQLTENRAEARDREPKLLFEVRRGGKEGN
jgi:polyphosphate kinase